MERADRGAQTSRTPAPEARGRRRLTATDPSTAQALALSSHPVEATVIALTVAFGALLSNRPLREVVLVLATVLVGRVTANWINDVVDRGRDAAARRRDKPVAQGQVHPGTVTFAVACATCLLVPLSITNGTAAGLAHLGSVAAAWAYNTRLKLTRFSALPWMVSFGLLPTFLSYGGWGGGTHGAPAQPLLTVLAALLGLGAHVTLALPDLVADNRAGVRSLPVVLALKVGAPRLLLITTVWMLLMLGGLGVAGLTVGLRA